MAAERPLNDVSSDVFLTDSIMLSRIGSDDANTSKGNRGIIFTFRTQKRGILGKKKRQKETFHAPLTPSYGSFTHLLLFSSGGRHDLNLHLLVADENSKLAPRPARNTLGLE